MKFESLFTKRTTICIVIMCLTLMCIGTFFDYQISIVLYDQSNWFGKIFAGYGQYPTSLAMSICGTILIYITKRKLSIKTILSYIGGIFLIANALFMAYFDPMQYIPELPIILNVLITFVYVGGLNFFVLRFVKGKERKEIVRFIQFTIFAVIVGFSRLIMGAHFLTDVTMGFAVGCFVVFSGYYIFYERKS